MKILGAFLNLLFWRWVWGDGEYTAVTLLIIERLGEGFSRETDSGVIGEYVEVFTNTVPLRGPIYWDI